MISFFDDLEVRTMALLEGKKLPIAKNLLTALEMLLDHKEGTMYFKYKKEEIYVSIDTDCIFVRRADTSIYPLHDRKPKQR